MRSARSARKDSGMYTQRSTFTRDNAAFLSNLTEVEIQHFRDIFRLFDTDKKESINVKKLSTAMSALGLAPSEDEVVAIIKEVDVSGTGEIDFQEFLTLMARSTANHVLEEELLATFRIFDRDSDGFISRVDLMEALLKVSERNISIHEAETIILGARAETNTEMKLSYEEFVAFMCANNHVA